jgi:hypothetical protein
LIVLLKEIVLAADPVLDQFIDVICQEEDQVETEELLVCFGDVGQEDPEAGSGHDQTFEGIPALIDLDAEDDMEQCKQDHADDASGIQDLKELVMGVNGLKT